VLRHCKILYIVGGTGNAERVDVSDLFAARLASAGLETDYVIFPEGAGPPWRSSKWRGARAFLVGRSSRAGLQGALISKLYEVWGDLRAFWLALTRPYDIIQVRDKFVVAVLGLGAAKLRGKIFTYWLSYPYAESRILDAEEGRARIPLASFLGGKIAGWLLYKVVMPRSDHVFVQSEQMRRDVALEGVPAELMTSVPMGVGDDLLERAPLPVTPRTVTYLGTLHRVRNLGVLVDAWPRVLESYPDAVLSFVGDGPDREDREYLERLVSRRGLTSSVIFTGMLPMRDAQDYVLRSAVCVSPFYPTPILQSTSPTKLVEYMALGRPVVANTHPEQSAVLEESRAGLCVEWSPEAFAAAFVALFAEPAAADEMGRRGREYVRSRRTYSAIAEKVAQDYARILARRSKPDAARSTAERDL
jgi:glycosyltransferase involved in cell wall biosynthesis